ncbi:MAG: SEC-C domain-containing protein [Spirochaetia bacterium]|nr:SEC-C domain-containing protein [Spirochaetia bacterium]
MNRPGRNDPCHCGSGKKYKKCCYDRDEQAQREQQNPGMISPDSGTYMDRYMELFNPLCLYARKILQFEKDGRELERAMKDFEDDFHPGEPGGVPDSFFNTWLYLDIRFGGDKKTLCELMMESAKKEMKGAMTDEVKRNLEILSNSYFTFYRISAVSGGFIVLNELYNNKQWKVYRIDDNEPYVPGKIIFVRLFGTVQEAFMASSPMIFDKRDEESIRNNIMIQTARYAEGSGISADEHAYAAACKHFFRHTLHLILGDSVPAGRTAPEIVNTSGDTLSFETLIYDIRDIEKFKSFIASMKMVEYDEDTKGWTWYKRGKGVMGSRTILGTMKVTGDELIAETNSQDRALSLMMKIQKELKSSVKFKKSESKTLQEAMKEHGGSVGKHSGIEQLPDEAAAEIEAYMENYLDAYYLEDWIKQPIPALDGMRPLDAAKTAGGREKLAGLISWMEQIEIKTGKGGFDFNKLRKKLKLL